jgi:hypothetical protein
MIKHITSSSNFFLSRNKTGNEHIT